MNREILFRGKRLDNGQWVYGGIRIVQGRYYIIPEDSNPFGFEVDPATVGQFVCLDCKGNNLFEDDIVKTRVTNARFKKNPRFENLVISYQEKYGMWENGRWGTFYPQRMEVIGNIHDNPEFLRGGQQ